MFPCQSCSQPDFTHAGGCCSPAPHGPQPFLAWSGPSLGLFMYQQVLQPSPTWPAPSMLQGWGGMSKHGVIQPLLHSIPLKKK